MRLLGLSLALVVFFGCAIVFVQRIGGAQYEADILPELKRCGDDWCVLGSISAQTAWDEIVRLCDRYACHSNRYGSLYLDNVKPGITLFVLQEKDEIAVNIRFGIPRQLSLASWLLHYGVPCAVAIDNFGHTLLLYRSILLNLGVLATPESQFALDTPVSSISVYSHERNLCSETLSLWHTTPWKGFMSLYSYLHLTTADH